MFHFRVNFVAWSICLIMAGCGASDRIAVYPVRGVVKFEGQPMAGGGSISFLPIEIQKGKTAGGTIDEQGRFVMSTYGDGDGSMLGKFRVLITQSVWDEPENQGDGKSASGPVKRVKDNEMIPAIYSNSEKSPVIVEVGIDTPSEITIELSSSAKH